MNRNLRNAKIKKYLSILTEYQERDYVPLAPFKGHLWSEEDSALPKKVIELAGGESILQGEQRNFRLTGKFRAGVKAGCETVLILELGKSKALEALSFLYGPEAVVYVDGKAFSGLDPHHSRILLAEHYLDEQEHTLCLEGWTGIKKELYETGKIGICYRNREIYRSTQLFMLCEETAEKTQNEDLYAALWQSLSHLDLYEPLGKGFQDTVVRAAEELVEQLSRLAAATPLKAALCGHGHLDLAWLWTTQQAKKKGVRTFLNVLRLMERHEDFRYSQTQAQLYQWLATEQPEMFAQVVEAVAAGKWEILGGMWVEPDCNLIGAESLVRQFILFHQYMLKTFQTTGSKVVWLPDTFGFCGQLPQLMREAGYDYFATAKLTWNQYNKMPAEYFWWEGIDGSRVLSYLVSTAKPGWWGATYSADLTPEELLFTAKEHGGKHSHDEILIAYGMGDGGGGPNEEMVSRGELLQEHPLPGLPKLAFRTFREFFAGLAESAADLPVWNGELYLELHRGTYTSQAAIKRNNRRCETALHQLEFLTAFAAVETGDDAVYPADCLSEMWQRLALNQFHDILPGSSIHEVYEMARKDHEAILRTCAELKTKAVEALSAMMPKETTAVVINSTSFVQSGMVELPFPLKENQILWADGEAVTTGKLGNRYYAEMENVPPYGFLTLTVETGEKPIPKMPVLFAGTIEAMADYGSTYITMKATKYLLFNQEIGVELDENGEVILFRDRTAERDISPPGEAFLQWRLYEDRPADWEAWDLDEDYPLKGFRGGKLKQAECFAIPGMVAGLILTKEIGRSTIRQEISIRAGEKDITVKVHLDYQESHQHLRLVCPVQIHHTFAEFGTQFGKVQRNTHYNTSWDQARFEGCMHKWADYSEGDYGIAVLSDNKYGISIHEGIISLAVAKSAVFPDPQADRGEQDFTVILSPHQGTGKREAIRKGYLLNCPLEIFPVGNGHGKVRQKSLITCDSPDIIVETVKRAEDNQGTVLRMYESNNTRGKTLLHYGGKVPEACRCSILEEKKEVLPLSAEGIAVTYRPFEIITLYLAAGK